MLISRFRHKVASFCEAPGLREPSELQLLHLGGCQGYCLQDTVKGPQFEETKHKYYETIN